MKKIGIIFAMEEELKEVLLKVNALLIEEKNTKFYTFDYNDNSIILTLSGVGKVNAARTCQLLIDLFDPSLIINVGVCGAISDGINVFDVICADKLYQYDFDISCFDHKIGYVPLVGDFIKVSDEELNDFIKINDCYNIMVSSIASGDTFVNDKDMKCKINEMFNASVCDMESFAIGQVSYLNNVSFIVLKVVSDSLSGTELEYEKFLERSCLIISDILFNYLSNI